MSVVLVTGANGFIALHIINELLKAGFSVVGTVRSPAKGKILDNFKSLYKNPQLVLEYVPDISKPDAFDEVVKNHPEVDYVLHTASPFSFGVGDDNEDVFVKPAVNGTLGILNSVKNYGHNVKHVVVTSSCAAILNFDKFTDHSFVHTEATWNPMPWDIAKTNPELAYCYSKTVAERSARDFVAKEKPGFTISTVNPSYVYGPQLFDETTGDLNTSSDLINQAMKLPHDAPGPFTEPANMGIDVRDVAIAHLITLQNPEKFADARLALACGYFSQQLFLDVLNSRIPELKGKIPVGDSAAGKQYIAENVLTYKFSKTEQLLGVKYISIEDSIYATAKQIVDYESAHK
ncbi:unnamed protein product [Kuraishia capsulata CBS 1993]|uniref:NAD-dependent epimerase/dehydratase domain-containing protein n=1 Tax=Kuraishia capsulata CBS 1993 TaxID=1382522 RepID=W6MSX0_9ASCO|nr:uncharacterized protein KUCA_T00005451001 [Kuraishia capsulata CBS 1993]CDK29463.1 unnamed protein product [Kuraishia capsulata CBS 1993]